MKRQAPDWEKILAKYITDKGLSCRIYKELSLLHNQQTTPHPKWSKDLKRHFTKTKHNLVSSDIHKHPYIQFLSKLAAKKGHEKVLSVINFTLYCLSPLKPWKSVNSQLYCWLFNLETVYWNWPWNYIATYK